MLNTFPSLLAWGMLAPLIIRIVVGLYFLEFGYSKLKGDRAKKATMFESVGLRPGNFFVAVVGLLELAVGVFLIAGAYTQIAAIVAGVISILAVLLKKKYPDSFANSSGVFFLLFVMSLSLLLTGAGFYSMDAPL